MGLVGFAVAAALAGAGAGPEFTAEQAKAAIEEHVARSVRDSGGIYRLTDPSGSTLELEFRGVSIVSAGSLARIHDPDRRVDERAFFACTRFHPLGGPEGKLYDLDMVVEPRDGALAVTDVYLHQETQLIDGKWTWRPWKAAPSAAARH